MLATTDSYELALQLRDTSSGFLVTKQFEIGYSGYIIGCSMLEDSTTDKVILEYNTAHFATQIVVLTSDFAVSQTKYLKFDTSSFLSGKFHYPRGIIFKGKSTEANLFHLALFGYPEDVTEAMHPNAFILEFNVYASAPINWKNNCDSGADYLQQRDIIELTEDNIVSDPVHNNFINGGNGLGNKHIDYWAQYYNNIFNVYNVRDDRIKKFVTAPDYLQQYSFISNTTDDSRSSLDECESIFQPRKITNTAGKYDYKTAASDQMIVRTDPYNIPADTFKQCQGLDITYYVKYFSSSGSDSSSLPSVSFMSIDDVASDVITINANTNAYANEDGLLDDYEIYEIMEFAEVSLFTDRYTTSDRYEIRLNMNKPPLLDDPSVSTMTMSARSRKTFTIRKGLNDEPTDILTFAVVAKKGGVIQSSEDWMAYEISESDEDLVTVIIDRPPNPLVSDLYSIEITYGDNFNPIPSKKTVALTVVSNNPPFLNEQTTAERNLVLNLPKVKIGESFEYFIPLKGFNDTDIDDYLFLYCDKTALPSWVVLVDNKLGYQIKGTVPASSSTGSYTLMCTISDTITYSVYNFVFTVVSASASNNDPQVVYSKLGDVYIDADDEYYGGLDLCSDKDGNTISYIFSSISSNNYYENVLTTSTSGSLKRKIKDTKSYLYFQNAASSDAGTYWVKFTCADNQAGANSGWGYVKLIAKPNTAPQAQRSSYSANSVSVHYSASTLSFALSNAFTDADKPHTMNSMKFYIADAPNKSQNIAFLASTQGTTADNNIVTFNVSPTKSKANAGRYNYYLVAEDPRGAKASMVISILIEGCDPSCKECRGTTKDECTDCFSGYNKVTTGSNTYGWCNVTCVNSYRLANNTCVACPSQCSSCTGPNPLTDCNACNADKSSFGIQCLDSCSGSLYTTSSTGPYTCQTVAAPIYTESTLRAQTFTYGQSVGASFTLANPQNGVDVKFSFIINKGISTQVNKNANISSSIPWITTSYNSGTNQLSLSITSAPDAVVPGTSDYYTVYVYMTNRNNQIAEAILQLTHFSNNAPYLRRSVKTALSAYTLPEAVNEKILKFWFDDYEGDSFSLSCVKPGLASWMTLSSNAIGDVIITGTPPSNNAYATTYNIDCTVNDGRNYRNTRTYTFTLKVNPNQAPVIEKTYPAISMTRRNNTVISFAGSCSDPESSSLTYSFSLAYQGSGNAASCSDFTFNSATQQLTLDFKTQACSGLYYIRISCSDSINSPVVNQISFTATDNLPIIAASVSTKSIKFTDKTLAFSIPSIFTDPESRPFTVSLVQANGNALPSYLAWSSSTSTMTFLGTYVNAGTIYLKLVAVDDVDQMSQAYFNLVIQGCHSYCSQCTDVYQSTCTACNNNYFLTGTSCRSYCDNGAYQDSVNHVCQTCPTGCDTCTGPDSTTQCSVCSEDYFRLDNGCYATCPIQYFANRQTMRCELISVTASNYHNYTECQTFLSNLRAQYPGYLTESSSSGVPAFDKMSGASASCTGLVGCSGGSQSGSTCTWTRKFALQCALSQTGLATIRVATNSMPDHCFGHASFFPQENQIDFEVAFNVRPSFLKTKAVNTQSLADSAYCDRTWQLDSNLRDYYSYIGHSGIRDNIVGVAINGVPIMNGYSEFNYDFIYPKAYGQNKYPKQIEVDVCLGYQLQTGFYHYYSASPCIFESPSRKQTHGDELCQLDDQECSTDPKQFITDAFKSVNVKKIGDYPIVGIARDGHFILGPYKLDGTNVWQPCDVDACNGVQIDDQYMYVTTFFYPYTVACWGPSNDDMTFAAKCSSNTKVCVEQQGRLSGNAMSQFASGIYSILLAFAAMMFFANMI